MEEIIEKEEIQGEKESESIKVVPELCKFRTKIPQKGGVLNIKYDFEEAQWTELIIQRKMVMLQQMFYREERSFIQYL